MDSVIWQTLSPHAVDLGALQEASVPPFIPLQLQFQGPGPVTEEALPAVQRLVVGFVGTGVPFAEPQTPATTLVNALQEALVPPLVPLQLQVQGPVTGPATALALPAVQRLVVGVVEKVERWEDPQEPFIMVAVINIPSGEYPVPVVFVA